MKKTISVLLCLCLALSVFTFVPFAASAAETTQDSVGASSGATGDCTWTLDNNGTLTISGNGTMGDYSYYFSGDTWITDFPWEANIKSVVIEDGVTNIGDYAFSGCTGLTSVTIPDSVTSIGWSAFSGCTGLTSVTISNSVTSIDGYAFSGCTGLTGVHITDIASWCKIAFEHSESNPLTYAHNLYLNDVPVTNLTIPDGVTSIGDSTFEGCSSLTSATISNSVTSIDGYAFSGCTGLTSVTVPDSVTTISDNAFGSCPNDMVFICNPGSAAEAYAINNGIKTSVQRFHFTILEDGTVEISEYLDDKTDVVIPATYQSKPVKSLKNWLFLNNSSITSVTIPDNVTRIGKGAFYSCVELKSVTMGNNVTEIGDSAFEKCLFLEEINLSTKLKTIGDEAFYDCRRLKQLNIPNTVTTIGEEAFTNCRSLTELVIPKGVQNLGNEESVGFGMFENCKNLKEITIPESVSYIQDNAFDGCGQVTIRAKVNSYAAQYTAANQLAFSKIDSEPVGDANGDSKINVRDVTSIQRHLADLETFTEEQLAVADTNGDGNVDIADATHLQMYLAEYDVVLGKR